MYGAQDDSAVRIGVGLNTGVLLVFAAVPPLLGMFARAAFPDLPDHDLALPTLLMEGLPPLVGALGLAALFSAEVSSSDAILFMLSTSLSQDLYRRFVRPSATDSDILRVARWAAVCGGALGTSLAIVSESIAGALSFFYTLLTVSLFVPVIAGLYLRRLSAPEAVEYDREWGHARCRHPDRKCRTRPGRSDAGDVRARWRSAGLGGRLGPQDAIRAVSLRAASRTTNGIS